LSPLEADATTAPNQDERERPITMPHITQAHGRKWYVATDEAMRGFRKTQFRQWYVYDNFGEKVHPGTEVGRKLTRLDAFRIMFPVDQMRLMIRLTNDELEKRRKKLITEGEMVKFFGTMVLMTRFRCRNRRELWKEKSKYKYQPVFDMGQTGMTRHRWDDIWTCIRFSYQPEERDPEMDHADWRWKMIDDFVKNFNDHRASNYYPSDKICIDESIVRWYGLGGDWINIGLPFYVALDRKPENGCEIQDACDGRSCIMMRLKIVKKPEVEAAYQAAQQHEDAPQEELQHGTEVLLDLVAPWCNKRGNPRCLAADSYFASVGCAVATKKRNLDLIGNVKQCHKEYPKAFLEALELPSGRGSTRSLVSYNERGIPELLATMWVDRDRKFFIGTCESGNPGVPQYRARWRQLESAESNAEPVKLMMEINMPEIVESYFGFCSKIDEINKQRQSELEMEKYVRTNEFWKRLGCSILSICIVDAMNLHQQCKPVTATDASSREWFSLLAEEMIDNDIDGVGTATRSSRVSAATPSPTRQVNEENTHHVAANLTPCKKKCKRGFTVQGKCKECNRKCTTMCRTCTRRHRTEMPFWLCNTNTGRNCWDHHYNEIHG
jgi:hypothetical protein